MPKQNDSRGDVRFTVPLGEVECFASGDPDAKGYTVRGHAAVFNRKSHDLGGFRTVISPGAFDRVLDENPDVHLLIDHDTRYVLARTKNKSLELRVDPQGLHMWARMVDTSYSRDLATLMEGGYVDQMSFACDIGDDTWEEHDGEVTRYIHEASALYDVTICAQGAFPQTDSQLVASMNDAGDLLASAIEAGRVEGREVATVLDEFQRHESGQEGIAQDTEVVGSPDGELVGAATVASSGEELAALKADAEARYGLLLEDLPS